MAEYLMEGAMTVSQPPDRELLRSVSNFFPEAQPDPGDVPRFIEEESNGLLAGVLRSPARRGRFATSVCQRKLGIFRTELRSCVQQTCPRRRLFVKMLVTDYQRLTHTAFWIVTSIAPEWQRLPDQPIGPNLSLPN
jgi:hypothetical protein